MLYDLRNVHSDVLVSKSVVSVIDKTTFLLTSRGVFSVVFSVILSVVISVRIVIILTVVILGGVSALRVREQTCRRYAQKQLNTSDRHAVQFEVNR